MTIIKATQEHAAGCERLFAIGAKEAPEAYEGIDVEALRGAISREETLVAVEGERIVGMVTAIPSPNSTWVAMLVVDPTYRGHKLATALIEAAKTDGKMYSIIDPRAVASFRSAGYFVKGLFVTNA